MNSSTEHEDRMDTSRGQEDAVMYVCSADTQALRLFLERNGYYSTLSFVA
jgi:hypothetical protein